MSTVVPFAALRPLPDVVSRVAALPYDVMNVEEARARAASEPLSFLRVEKSEIDLPDSGGVEDLRIYAKAKENLHRLHAEGVFVRESKPCFYVYRQRMGGRFQTGITAGISVAEYEAGIIKKHEFTRADKERERTLHIDTLCAQTGPVFIAYRGRKDIDAVVAAAMKKAPLYDFTADDGNGHTVWRIDDEKDIAALRAGFAAVDALYIADGHHRCAAAAAVGRKRREANPGHTGKEEYNFTLAVLFPHDQLCILDYNRVVKDLNGMDEAEFLRRVAERFDVHEGFAARTPARSGEFGMFLKGRWRRLVAKPDPKRQDDPIASLDVSILQTDLLEPLLGIQDPRTDKRIDFVGGIRGMDELERLVGSGRFAVAFSLFPASLDELMAVADAGKVMPPKSTWFEPKLRSGIFVHTLEGF
jgi:uncharacterized protein (DUF1015 family)